MTYLKKLNLRIVIIVFLASFTLPSVVMATKVSEGSTVAGVDVADLSIEEAKEKIKSMTEVWKEGPSLIAESDYETIEIPRDIFVFDLEKTFSELEEKMKRHWSNFFMKPKNVNQELFVELSGDALEQVRFPEYVDAEQTLSYAVIQAKHLTAQSVTLSYSEDFQVELKEIANVTLEIPEELSVSSINYLVEDLDEQLIASHTIYSFLEKLLLPSAVGNAEKEMSFIASGLYQLALQSDLEILERHIGEKVPGYIEEGLEAFIDRENEIDLKLYHENEFSYTVQAERDEKQVELSLLAPSTDIDFSFEIENKIDVEPKTIYRYNPDLNAGQQTVVQEGENGLQLEVYRIENSDVGTSDKVLISRDFYPPTPKIVEVSTEVEAETGNEQENNGANNVLGNLQESLQDSTLNPLLPKNPLNPSTEECEDDPSLCEQDEDVNMLSMLMACSMLEEGGEDVKEMEEFCGMLYFLLLMSMLSNGLDFDSGEIDDPSFNVEELDGDFNLDDWLLEDELNVEGQESILEEVS